jgi:hypothetical protein
MKYTITNYLVSIVRNERIQEVVFGTVSLWMCLFLYFQQQYNANADYVLLFPIFQIQIINIIKTVILSIKNLYI